jgi:hypothetical protein
MPPSSTSATARTRSGSGPPGHSGHDEMQNAAPDPRPATPTAGAGDAPLWPWSYRIAGASSPCPAVELYEAGSLLDVVSSTTLVVQVLRGARSARAGGSRRVVAWGRIPPDGRLPAVEFSRGRLRRTRRDTRPIRLTSWCWLAVAGGPYDAATVTYGTATLRCRLGRSRQWL